MSHESSVSGMGGGCVGNKSDKSEAVASNLGRNQNNLRFWEGICKVNVGIHRQARVGELGFLTFEEIKTRKLCTY
jgi:hypothetical protein